MDKQLHEKSINNQIKDFFQLNTTPVVWVVDEYYTTESNDLDNKISHIVLQHLT